MAVAGGVAVLVFVRGMQDGFVEGRLERGLLLQLGHAVVKSGSRVIADGALLARELEKIGAVKAASPRTRFQGILKAGGRAAGVQGLGVDAGDESRASLLPASIVAGRFLGEPSKPGTVPLTLGVHLAKELDVGLGDRRAHRRG
jgi:ABC-type lipoprotein release transport system permease subunit